MTWTPLALCPLRAAAIAGARLATVLITTLLAAAFTPAPDRTSRPPPGPALRSISRRVPPATAPTGAGSRASASASRRRSPTSRTAASPRPSQTPTGSPSSITAARCARSIGACRRSPTRSRTPRSRSVVAHLRSFCRDEAWPRGELNLPRAQFTEKAFPENEALVTTAIDAEGPGAIDHARRLRAALRRAEPDRNRAAGLGRERRRIVARRRRRRRRRGQACPRPQPRARRDRERRRRARAAHRRRGLGARVTRVEPFVSFGQLLPVRRVRSGASRRRALERSDRAPNTRRSGAWRSAGASRGSSSDAPGRRCSSCSVRASSSQGERIEWDVVPQLQVTLSKRQHIMVSGGLQLPLTRARPSATRDWCSISCGTGSTAASPRGGRCDRGPLSCSASRLVAIPLASIVARGRRAASARSPHASRPARLVPRVSQRTDDARRRRRLDRRRVARIDDGQLVARPVLAGLGPARNPRSSRSPRGHRGRVRNVPHADGAGGVVARRGGRAAVFAHLPIGRATAPLDALAADGVSCTLCHQILPDGLGRDSSFNGGFALDPTRGRQRATGLRPVRDRRRPLDASCDRPPASGRPKARTCGNRSCARRATRSTRARSAPDGQVIGRLPEQVPYLEWRQSAYRDERSCQAATCPSSATGRRSRRSSANARPGWLRHSFRGGNAFMLRVLEPLSRRARRGGDAGGARRRDSNHDERILRKRRRRVSIDRSTLSRRRRLVFEVAVRNLAGHKLPTAYPSRRVWLHVRVRDAAGRTVFESGALDRQRGDCRQRQRRAISRRFEPHHRRDPRTGARSRSTNRSWWIPRVA